MSDDILKADEALLIEKVKAEIKPGKLPEWLEANTLPQLLWSDGRVAPVRDLVLHGLKKFATEESRELFTSLRLRLDPKSAAELAWTIFDRWLRAGGPPAHKWCFYALGEWGDETAARSLGRMVRDWPTQKKFKRAEQGLEVLERMGTDAALAEIDAIAQSTKSAAIKAQAAERIRHAAKKRGLSAEELSDRLVPTFGMDTAGRLVLDYGPRQFTAQLEADFTLTLFDDAGKIRKSAPKSASDDPSKANRAAELLKAARKGLKDQFTLQSGRLERAMVDGRHWTAGNWQRYLLDHPLLRRLSQRVLWYKQSDGKMTPFRVAEDFTLADQEEQILHLLDGDTIGLVHPLLVDETILATWRTIFGDYEIVSPFEQLTRQVFQPTSDETKTVPCERYVGYMLDGRQLIAQLARFGWRQGTPRAYGSLFLHSRYYPAAKITAVLHHGGVLLGYYEEAIETALGPVMFLRGAHRSIDDVIESAEYWLPIAEVHPVPFSETLRDVDRLAKSGTGFDPAWRKKMGM